MKKNTTARRQIGIVNKMKAKRVRKGNRQEKLTIGLDLGDRSSSYCILDEQGEVMLCGEIPTSKSGLDHLCKGLPASRVTLEVGTHSPWVSRYIAALGHEVIVANPRNVAWITKSRNKNDRLDAEKLARLARVDVKLLAPIQHRREETQRDLAVIRGRADLVEARTKLINCVRGLVKSLGERLKGCDSERVGEWLLESVSPATGRMALPLLRTVAEINAQIDAYDQQIAEIGKRYPEIELLTAVYGVGELTALTFVLTLEDPARFAHSRDVGAYLGMRPRQDQSGQRDPQLRISKEGDRHLRWMLVECAQCILRRRAVDSDLRRWGLAKLEEQDKQRQNQKNQKKKNRKKRVLVAVARKLAVLLHHLWVNGEVYDPLYQAKATAAESPAA